MPRSRGWLLALAAPLACQNTVGLAVHRPSPRSSAATTTAASPDAPGPTGGLLQRPAGPTNAVTGQVAVEAQYAVTHGGSLISDSGGAVVRLADASVIANNGGNFIANNGGSIIANNGGGLIANNGGGLIANNGGGLVANSGGGLVANNGGRQPGAGGAPGYRLAQATAAPAFGTVVPAAGLVVGVEDLATGTLLPLGTDAAGKPVMALTTDAHGGFTAYLPPTAKAVRVIGVPGRAKDDRLTTTLLTTHLGDHVALDEDTARVADAIRQGLLADFYRGFHMSSAEIKAAADVLARVDPGVGQAMIAGLGQLQVSYKQVGVADAPLDQQLALAGRLADLVLAASNLEAIHPVQAMPAGFAIPGAPSPAPGTSSSVLDTVGQSLRAFREAVSRVMQAKADAGQDPTAYFAAKRYIQDANDRDQTTYQILKPADFNDFLVHGVANDINLPGTDSSILLVAVLADQDLNLPAAALDLFARSELGLSTELTRAAYAGTQAALPTLLAETARFRVGS